jgi:hypothetical protein
VIISACGSIKNCINSIFEGELMGGSDGVDTREYLDHLGTERQMAFIATGYYVIIISLPLIGLKDVCLLRAPGTLKCGFTMLVIYANKARFISVT